MLPAWDGLREYPPSSVPGRRSPGLRKFVPSSSGPSRRLPHLPGGGGTRTRTRQRTSSPLEHAENSTHAGLH